MAAPVVGQDSRALTGRCSAGQLRMLFCYLRERLSVADILFALPRLSKPRQFGGWIRSFRKLHTGEHLRQCTQRR